MCRSLGLITKPINLASPLSNVDKMSRNAMLMLHIIGELLPKFGMGKADHLEEKGYHIDSYMHSKPFYSVLARSIIIIESYKLPWIRYISNRKEC